MTRRPTLEEMAARSQSAARAGVCDLDELVNTAMTNCDLRVRQMVMARLLIALGYGLVDIAELTPAAGSARPVDSEALRRRARRLKRAATQRGRNAAWRAANPDRVKAYAREYYLRVTKPRRQQP